MDQSDISIWRYANHKAYWLMKNFLNSMLKQPLSSWSWKSCILQMTLKQSWTAKRIKSFSVCKQLLNMHIFLCICMLTQDYITVEILMNTYLWPLREINPRFSASERNSFSKASSPSWQPILKVTFILLRHALSNGEL